MLKKTVCCGLSALLALSLCGFAACAGKPAKDKNVIESPTGELPVSPSGEPLALSHESGVYTEDFALTVQRGSEGHRVYYTLDGSVPTVNSKELKGALKIVDDYAERSYPLTESVTYGDADTYGSYTFGTGNACTVVNLLEVDGAGNEVARTTKSYFIRAEGEAAFPLPVVSISMPQEDAVSFYNDVENESKERAEMEYIDFATGERFARNTQIKLGGNWTKGFPYRTMNVNFNKDENDEKNEPVTADIFRGRKARDGGELTDFRRFRLHSGGNAQTLNWFADAFAQRVAAEVSGADGEYITAATTGYRPVEVYLNGEYWGMYAIREHYSDVYFEQNYGVDKDDVILVDRSLSIVAGDPDYADETVYNTDYHFELAEDDDAAQGMRLAEELFDFLCFGDLGDPSEYSRFESMVDVESLIDMVLVHMYAGNWDFMNNNIKMWRTATVDPENPYADGKWRFCLHDLDFSFEFQWGDNGLRNANGYLLYDPYNIYSFGSVPLSEYTSDTITYRPGANYLDFFLGNAYLEYNGVGQLGREDACLLSAPAENAGFREQLAERAALIKEVYTSPEAFAILNEMESEVREPMRRHQSRWDRADYWYSDWEYFVERTETVLRNRNTMSDDLGYFGYRDAMYANGDYFDRQIEAAFWRFCNGITL